MGSVQPRFELRRLALAEAVPLVLPGQQELRRLASVELSMVTAVPVPVVAVPMAAAAVALADLVPAVEKARRLRYESE